MSQKLDKHQNIQWQYLRRHPEYKADFTRLNQLKISKADLKYALLKKELTIKWGLFFYFPDPEIAELKKGLFQTEPTIHSEMLCRNDLIEKTLEDGTMIYPATWQLVQKARGKGKNNDESFMLLLLNLDTYSNASEVLKELTPLIKDQFKKLKKKKQLRTIKELQDNLRTFDEFSYELSVNFNMNIKSIAATELEKYLSLKINNGKMFKTYLADLWGMSHPNNVVKLMKSIFEIMNEAPYIGISKKGL